MKVVRGCGVHDASPRGFGVGDVYSSIPNDIGVHRHIVHRPPTHKKMRIGSLQHLQTTYVTFKTIYLHH